MGILETIYTILTHSCVVRSCFVLILTGLVCFIIRIVYRKTLHRLTESSLFLNLALLKALYRPLLIFLALVGFTYSLEWLCLGWQRGSLNLFFLFRHFAFIILCAWFLWTFVSLYSQFFLKHDSKDDKNKVDSTLVSALRHIAKITIIIATALALFQLFGLSIAGVLAFGGMGGIIIGFATKDLLANIFGSLLLFFNRPFEVGDQIALPTLKVEGKVETIGWRCSILTAEGRPVYVPSALFSNLLIENRSRMKYRRLSCSLSLRYQDFGKVLEILKEIESLLDKIQAIDKQRGVTVNLSELAQSSLEISINACTTIIDNAKFLAMQQAFYLELIKCIDRNGAKWAFPSSNIFLNAEDDVTLLSKK